MHCVLLIYDSTPFVLCQRRDSDIDQQLPQFHFSTRMLIPSQFCWTTPLAVNISAHAESSTVTCEFIGGKEVGIVRGRKVGVDAVLKL